VRLQWCDERLDDDGAVERARVAQLERMRRGMFQWQIRCFVRVEPVVTARGTSRLLLNFRSAGAVNTGLPSR
jgi:hypothetical protein